MSASLFVMFMAFGTGICVASCMHNRKDTLILGFWLVFATFIPVLSEILKGY